MSDELDKYIEKYPTYIEALDIIDDLKKKLKAKEEEFEKANAVAEFYKSYYVSFHSKVCDELIEIYNLFEPYENSQKETILCSNNGISFIDYLDERIKEMEELANGKENK